MEEKEILENDQERITEAVRTAAQEEKPDFSFRVYESQGVYRQPAQTVVMPAVPEKKPRKAWKIVLAAVLAVALVAGSCGITGAIVSASWREQLKLTAMNFQDKLNALESQLKGQAGNLGGGSLVGPQVGKTPAQIYQENVQSVVAISATSTVNNFGQNYTAVSAGSGFVLSEDGYIVTNHHVINGATTVTVVTSDETKLDAVVVGFDASNDIALLKVEAKGMQAVTIGSSEVLAVGSQVVAIGNALGELSASLTVGYISGKDRTITTDGTIINMLQTDAAINSGNSGGPLFNMDGQVVGITTAKYSGATSSGASIEGICFAIPMDDVIGMLEDLRDHGYITGVQMGVMVRNVEADVAEMYGFPVGVYVESVVKGSCAEAAGVQGKDIITEVGGYEIENMNDLTRALRKFKAGDVATVKVWRGGQEVLLSITFEAKIPG